MTSTRQRELPARAWRVGLLAWIAVAAVLFVLAPPPPQPHATDSETEAVRQRLVAWVGRNAQSWHAERGDLVIPWDEAKGHLAIVVDDVGRELHYHQQLQDLRFRLTFSVLPSSVYAAGAQLRLRQDRRRYREILLHLPLEPLDPAQMSDGPEAREEFLLAADSPARLRDKLGRALAAVPTAVGVNNHMGSRLTADREAMDALWSPIRDRGLFFLDSRTTAESVAEASARDAGVVALSRSAFLDHDPSPVAVGAALARAADGARAEPVVVICHPSAAVVDVLRDTLPALHEQGIGVYPVSEVMARIWRDRDDHGAPPPPA